jgi:hypothetical protein
MILISLITLPFEPKHVGECMIYNNRYLHYLESVYCWQRMNIYIYVLLSCSISLTFSGAQVYMIKQNMLLKYTFVYSVCLYMYMHIHIQRQNTYLSPASFIVNQPEKIQHITIQTLSYTYLEL